MINSKKGIALILSLVAFITALGIIAALHLSLETTHQSITHVIATKGQAVNMANAGLVDVLNWFRRFYKDRGNFDPQRLTQCSECNGTNLDKENKCSDCGEHNQNETEDPYIGLVREHVISDSPYLIGRYEIRKKGVDPSGGVKDISSERNSVKTIFYIESKAFIFSVKNKDTYKPTDFYLKDGNTTLINRYNLKQVVLHSKATMISEIIQTEIKLPADAAICHKGSLKIYSKGEVRSYNDSYRGAAHPSGTSSAYISGGVLSPSQDLEYGDYNDTIPYVFGLKDEDALTTGDDKTVFSSNTVSNFKMPEYKITFIGKVGESPLPTFTFNEDIPLSATSAIVYARGNVLIDEGSNSNFSGILYVVGNLTIKDPSYINGAIIVKGNTTISGSVDASMVIYQRSIVDDLQKMMGQYTFNIPPYLKESEEKTLSY